MWRSSWKLERSAILLTPIAGITWFWGSSESGEWSSLARTNWTNFIKYQLKLIKYYLHGCSECSSLSSLQTVEAQAQRSRSTAHQRLDIHAVLYHWPCKKASFDDLIPDKIRDRSTVLPLWRSGKRSFLVWVIGENFIGIQREKGERGGKQCSNYWGVYAAVYTFTRIPGRRNGG